VPQFNSGDFSMPEYLVEDAANIVTQQIGGPDPLLQLPWDDGLEHNWVFWNGTNCCLCKEFPIMAECFQIFLVGGETCAPSIHRTRLKLDKMVNIHDISYVFRTVSSIFRPIPSNV
jgi:hypothetical protein